MKSKNILFVDDEPWINEALRAVLESRGFNCISKSDMSSGWRYLEKNDVAVLVTDIMMPAGDLFPGIDSSDTGFHFVGKVKDKWPAIAIICLSVIGDVRKINLLKKRNILYLRKGETNLETAANLIESKATGIYTFKPKK